MAERVLPSRAAQPGTSYHPSECHGDCYSGSLGFGVVTKSYVIWKDLANLSAKQTSISKWRSERESVLKEDENTNRPLTKSGGKLRWKQIPS